MQHTEYRIGLDGSLANFGYSVCLVDTETNKVVKVEELILSKTTKDKTKGVKRADDDLMRFRQHWVILNETIDKYDIKIAYGEIPTGGQDARAAFAFGGVTMLLAAMPIPLVTLTPLQVKAITGVKYAEKEDVIRFCHTRFPDANWRLGKRSNAMDITTKDGMYLTNDNEHLADATATVIAGLLKK